MRHFFKQHYHQLTPFALVGIISTAVYVILITTLVSYFGQNPLFANIIAYIVTFQVSYIGHKYFTFASLTNSNKQLRLPHFLVISIAGGLLNEGLYYLMIHYTPFHYLFSLIVVIGLVAIFTFLTAKYWACR
jgi:putative flippase GtrA